MNKRALILAMGVILAVGLFGCSWLFGTDPIVQIGVQGRVMGESPFEVTFFVDVLQNSSEIVEYRWDFGDGSPVEYGSTVTHVFTNEDDDLVKPYDVRLSVMDADGRIGETSQTISVAKKPDPPVINWIGYELSGTCCKYVTLWADVNQPVDEYEWDLGDGSFDTRPSLTHRYAFSGHHTVSLRVKGENGVWSAKNSIRIWVGHCGDPCYPDPCYPYPCYDCFFLRPSSGTCIDVYGWQTITAHFYNCSSCCSETGTCGLDEVTTATVEKQCCQCNCWIDWSFEWACQTQSDSSTYYDVWYSGNMNEEAHFKPHKKGEWRVVATLRGTNFTSSAKYYAKI